MRLLVTGGAGFIGSEFVRSALRGELPLPDVERVIVLDALTYAGCRDNLAACDDDPRFSFVHGDIRDAALARELAGSVDAVVHCAAESHVDRSLSVAHDFAEVNVGGTATILQACAEAGVERVVHVSTDEVYGSITSGSWPETHPLAPSSPYSASKAGSDLMALAFHTTHGLPVTVTRCSNNYGPYQFPEKVIPLFVTNLLDGLPVPLYGDGRQVRDWLHVSDHCRGLALALTRGAAGEIYNLGGGTELENIELTRLLLEQIGADESSIERVTDRPGHDRRYSVDDAKARRELGYKPQVPFEQGLAETVTFYREHRQWWEPLKTRAGMAMPWRESGR